MFTPIANLIIAFLFAASLAEANVLTSSVDSPSVMTINILLAFGLFPRDVLKTSFLWRYLPLNCVSKCTLERLYSIYSFIYLHNSNDCSSRKGCPCQLLYIIYLFRPISTGWERVKVKTDLISIWKLNNSKLETETTYINIVVFS